MTKQTEKLKRENYEQLRLENQLCFPLYACAKEVVRRYRKPLEPLQITYTQYIAMLAFWEYGSMTEKELGNRLMLDSGTLAPLLKRLEKQGLVVRARSEEDERSLIISLTKEGEALKEKAADVPAQMAGCLALNQEEAMVLYRLLYKALSNMSE